MGRLVGCRYICMYTDIPDHLLYVLLATTLVSLVFIEACATCSPINACYRVMIFKCSMPCSHRFEIRIVGCLSFAQKISSSTVI